MRSAETSGAVQAPRVRSIIVFHRPFRLPGLDEVLEAGSYVVEIETATLAALRDPDWRASVRVELRAQPETPALARTLTVPLADFQRAQTEDGLSRLDLAEHLLSELLADPMVRLAMASDGVSEADIRRIFSGDPSADGSDDR